MTTKELETLMDSYEKIIFDLQESMQNSFAMMQKSIEGLMVLIATQHKGPKITTEDENHSGTHEPIVSVVDRAQIPFPFFDGSNYREWNAKSEQFFELEGTPKEQRSRLLLLSMDGKAFAWQRHYIQNMNNKHKMWQHILQDVGS